MSQVRTARRVVTGHDAQGNAIFTSDDVLNATDPRKEDGSPPDGSMLGFVNLHRTTGLPATNKDPIADPYGKMISLVEPDSVTCRIVDFPVEGPEMKVDDAMHRTVSLDYGVVLKGTIQCILDNGVEKTINEGDVVVQRGTSHAWKNISKENCRMLFVLIPAEPYKVDSTGETLAATPVKLLS